MTMRCDQCKHWEPVRYVGDALIGWRRCMATPQGEDADEWLHITYTKPDHFCAMFAAADAPPEVTP